MKSRAWPVWVGLTWLLATSGARAGEPPIVVVDMVESRGSPLAADGCSALSDLLAAWLTEDGRLRLVRRDVPLQRSRAELSVHSSVAKIGAQCMWTLTAYDLRKNTAIASASERTACQEDALADSLQRAAGRLVENILTGKRAGEPAAPPADSPGAVSPLPRALADSGKRAGPVVALFGLESRGSPLNADELSSLTDYLGAQLGEDERFQVLPRSELKMRLGPTAAHEVDACHEPVCRHHISRQVGAAYALSIELSKVGSQCLLAAGLIDVSSGEKVKAITERTACNSDAVVSAMEKMAGKLAHLLQQLR